MSAIPSGYTRDRSLSCPWGWLNKRFFCNTTLKSGHTIGDGFDPRHGGTASSKGFEDQKDQHWLSSGNVLEVADDWLMLKEKVRPGRLVHSIDLSLL